MIKAVLTDIEGTTTSIRFVHDVLFPYAATHISDFVRSDAQDPEVQRALQEVAVESGVDVKDLDALIGQLLSWIEQDKKVTPLKTLQGLLWRKGYEKGDFQGHIYPDVTPVLSGWRAEGVSLYVYSSGSVEAQKLLFSHTMEGDLTTFFSGYFDTRTGGKKESASYLKIAHEIGLQPPQVLFLSDVPAELDAASAVGMKVCQLVRDEETEKQEAYPAVSRFDDIVLSHF